MKLKNCLYFIAGTSLCLPSLLYAKNALTPETFLNQVVESNEGIRGAKISEKSSKNRTQEGTLIYSTSFFANAQSVDDKKPTASVASQGDESKAKILELGLSKVTPYGLAGKVSYVLSDVTVFNTNPAYLPMPSYTDSSLKVELNQPLWQNAFGRQYRNMEEASDASAKATSLGKRYETQMLLLDAEIKYWKLAAIRESIDILKMNVEQTKKVLEFNRTKVKRNLTDETDLFQSQAQVKSRILDLQSSLDEEKDAMRILNAARNVDSDLVAEETHLPQLESIIQKLKGTTVKGDVLRNDVKAAAEGLRATKASNKISEDKILPDLSVFAVGSFTKRDVETSKALSGYDSNHPYTAIGVKLSLPLDFDTRSTLKNAYAGESLGAELTYKKKLSDQETEWKSLNAKIALIAKRLILAKELKDAQSVKLNNERERQKNGKSTMFQVFQFEQEYLASQLNLVQLQANAMVLLAQAKTFYDLEY